jgi:hypothetical protein
MVMSIIRKYGSFMTCCLFAYQLIAQTEPALRMTFDAKDYTYELIPLANQSFVVVKKDNVAIKQNIQWVFTKYDSHFEPVWTNSFYVPRGQNLLKKDVRTQYIAWLFAEPDALTGITIVKIDLNTGVLDEEKGNLMAIEELSHFKVLNTKAVVGGLYEDKPVVAIFNFFDGSTKILPNVYSKGIVLNDVIVEDETQEIKVLLHNELKKEGCGYHVNVYNYNGVFLRKIELPRLGDKTYITAKLANINPEKSILIGTYSHNCSTLAEGLYTAVLNDDETPIVHFFDYTDIPSSYHYLSPKRIEKIKEKVELKKEEGKDIALKFNTYLQDIIQTPNQQLLLIAHWYYNDYKPNNTRTIIQYPFLNLDKQRHEESFRYFHALLCSFDDNGQMLWNNSMSTKNMDRVSGTSALSVQVAFVGQQEQTIAYIGENKIASQIVKEKDIIRGIHYKPIVESTDTVAYAELLAWYNSYFLLSGYQDIAIPTGQKDQQVFFVERVVL